MFLGILIGMAIFGLLMVISNIDAGRRGLRDGVILCAFGWFFLLIGFCGAVGWIIEVLI